jgi:hypothetical protein
MLAVGVTKYTPVPLRHHAQNLRPHANTCSTIASPPAITEMEEPTFRSYSEYVRHLSLDYPELGWLSDFLSYPGSTPSVTRVRIVDSIEGGLLRTQDFTVSGKPLTEALKDRPGDILTRLVIVSYFQSWNIDRDVVNTIGMHFKLDPWFLWGHLDHYYESNDALCKNRRRDFQPKPIEALPSERASAEIALGSMGVSAVILGPSPIGGQLHFDL